MRFYGPSVLRLCVAVVFIAHGAQKLFGIWGGPGLTGTIAMVKSLGMPIPYPPAVTALAVLLALTEFLGGIALLTGALTRWASAALLIVMGVAVWKVHLANGFFLGSHGNGIEFNLVIMGALVCLMMTGPGALSVDEFRSESAEAQARGRARARKV